MTTEILTRGELRRAGIAALVETLGAVQAMRFLHEYASGEGDYTAARQELLGEPPLEELIQEIAAARTSGA